MDIYVPRKAYKSFRKELCKLLHVAPSTISTMDLDTGDQEGYAVSKHCLIHICSFASELRC